MKTSLQEVKKRQDQIFELIQSQGECFVRKLADFFDVSVVTIRKDLDTLASSGKVTRIHGGARKNPTVSVNTDLPSYTIVSSLLADENSEKTIAKRAADFIEDQDIILLNSSITASYVIDYLDDKNVTIITNNIATLNRKHKNNLCIVYTGGIQQNPSCNSLTGVYTIDFISRIVATKCVLGVNGVNASLGIFSPNIEESNVNKKMIEQTNGAVIILATGDKIGKSDGFFTGEINKTSYLVTNSSADSNRLKELYDAGVRSFVADEKSITATPDIKNNETAFNLPTPLW